MNKSSVLNAPKVLQCGLWGRRKEGETGGGRGGGVIMEGASTIDSSLYQSLNSSENPLSQSSTRCSETVYLGFVYRPVGLWIEEEACMLILYVCTNKTVAVQHEDSPNQNYVLLIGHYESLWYIGTLDKRHINTMLMWIDFFFEHMTYRQTWRHS